MLLYQFLELVCTISFFFLHIEVNCQRVNFYPYYYDQPSAASSRCNADSSCIPIDRCDAYRNSRNWRTAGTTCRMGYGRYRRVCCPPTSSIVQPPSEWQLPPRTPVVRSPPTVRTPPPTVRPPPQTPPVYSNNIECGQSRPLSVLQIFIMDGENATEGAWPWMVAIRQRGASGNYNPSCTGALIDRIHVLSAAHCFHRRGDDMYRARIGRVNQNEGEEYRIVRIDVPDGYIRGMFYDDLAVLTLDREVNVPNFNPICLPDARLSRIDLIGFGTTVAGWGAEIPDGPMTPQLKQLSEMRVLSNQECNRIFRMRLSSFQRQFPRGVDDGFLCAGILEGGKDSCMGDSGGPLMYRDRNRWFLVGIVSFGVSCGRPGIPGGYTRVSNYLDFIRRNTID